MSDELVTPLADPLSPSPGRDRFDLVALATHTLIWDWDLLKQRLVWAGSTEQFFGCAADEVDVAEGDDRRPWANRVHPDDLKATEAASVIALNDGADTWEHTYRLRRIDGSWATVLERAAIVRDAEGHACRVVGSVRDVTSEVE